MGRGEPNWQPISMLLEARPKAASARRRHDRADHVRQQRVLEWCDVYDRRQRAGSASD